MLNRKLPFVGKSYKEMGILGRISYIASTITAVVAAATAVWQVFWWASDQMNLAEKTALWQAESILHVESQLIEDDPDKKERYAEIQRRIEELNKALKN